MNPDGQPACKVLSVIHGPRWGGIHTLAERVGPECALRGYPWVMVLPRVAGDNGAERLRQAGLEVETISLRRIRKSANLLTQLAFLASIPIDVYRLHRLIRRHRISLVQANGLLHFHSVLAGRLAGVPVVWVLHSDQPPRLLKRIFTPWVRRMASAVLTSGRSLVETHPGLERIEDRVFAFAAPVDTDRFRPDPDLRASARDAFGAAQDDLVIGTVGGRGPNKNHGMLIEMMKIVREAEPRIKLRICGAPQPDHAEWYESHVVAPARRGGMVDDGTVAFTDPGREIPRCMNGFDVFCLSSRGEGASIVVSEAMACGIPVVANAVGGVPESVLDGETGFLNRSLTAEEMARHVLRLVAEPELRMRMGTAARGFALQNRSIAACADAHVDAFRHALADRGHRSLPAGGSELSGSARP